MRLIIKTNSYKAENDDLEILANMEDFYAMLDRINPMIIRNYITSKVELINQPTSVTGEE